MRPKKGRRASGAAKNAEMRLGRRDLLKAGALGLVATALPAAEAVAIERLEPQEPKPQQPGAEAAKGDDSILGPKPPAIGDVVDVEEQAYESWQEPWVWRPAEWPDQALDLNVVQNRNPGESPSPGNRYPMLYSYGGESPAPTIRVRGDGLLKVKLRNLMGLDHGWVPVGPSPDPVDLTPEMDAEACRLFPAEQRDPFESFGIGCEDDSLVNPFAHRDWMKPVIPAKVMPGWAVPHANGFHSARVTNLHTHGLHVEPNTNPDGSQSDNVYLRVLSRADWAARQRSDDRRQRHLGASEKVAEVDFSYHLGDVLRARRHREGGPPEPQPPGTHWYHPHAHGSTHDHVASGMAGFLILEGDVDDAINRSMTGGEHPDPQEKTGPYDYRERVVLIQRVEVQSTDPGAGRRSPQLRNPPVLAVNGARPASTIHMRPGAVERWRVLNGSVDGRGFKRFMVLDGQYVHDRNRLWRVEGAGDERHLVLASRAEVAAAKRPLYQLAFDGITLVTIDDGRPRYTVKDLSQQNPGSTSPLDREIPKGEHDWKAALENVEDCYRDGKSLRDAFVRPNEVYLGAANRADVFFKAPLDGEGKVYTLFAQEVLIHTDNFQQRLQLGIASGEDQFNPAPHDVPVAYLHVRGQPVEGGDFDVLSLRESLPDVPPFLQPIGDEELRVPADEARQRGVSEGSYRTRVVSYSGWGGGNFPLVEVPEHFAKKNPELERLVWTHHDGTAILLPPVLGTMAINSRLDLVANPEPPPPRKFSPQDDHRIRVLVDTAEEWALYNLSTTLWSHTDTERFPQRGQYKAHYRSYPITRAEGQARFARDPEFQITAKGADHPFHIHINPCWVTRIEVPDENGELHNILDEPRWMDTISIPRNGGRVVFRTRHADYVGRWVHHCHFLAHEDNGMMQEVVCTERAEECDYNTRTQVASATMTSQAVSKIYPRLSPESVYRQNLSFLDANHETGQVYPGFDFEVPVLEEED